MANPAVLNKRKLITDHAAGLSYVDIGGLWGTKGETVTTALAAGASRAAMADKKPLGNVWWQRFAAHSAERGFTDYDEIWVDICAPDARDRLGSFDFVHCSGVMYHVPDLLEFVGTLVAVTKKYLLLSSVVMPPQIGPMSFGPDDARLAPILSDENMQALRDYLQDQGIEAEGVTRPAEFMRDGSARTGPWWWLFSGEFMSRVVSLFGLNVLAEGRTPKGHGYTVFAELPG
jgi:hypothetical protein